VTEPGSDSLDHLFLRANESQHPSLFFSAWNIGEILGALDTKRRGKVMTDDEYSRALSSFIDETIRLTRQGALLILPVAGKLLTSSWQILLQEKLYQADALQIASCKEAECEQFLSADHRLLDAAKRQGITALDPERDGKKLAIL
jgi:uncharacterized protein